jgi:XFP-like protein
VPAEALARLRHIGLALTLLSNTTTVPHSSGAGDVNVVDLMTLIRQEDHPHGMGEIHFAELFTESANVIFAFHGFCSAVHHVIDGVPVPRCDFIQSRHLNAAAIG